jgi:hypothetical protein
MPNHVTTVCKVAGAAEELERFRSTLFTPAEDDDEPALFDFNRIVPMPAALEGVESSSQAEWGAALILARADDTRSFFEKNIAIPDVHWARMMAETGESHAGAVATRYLELHPEYEVEGLKRLRAIVETGFASWYPWNIKHWGTKWGSYRVEVTDDGTPFSFRFETAWSFPEPIFAALVEQFPGLTFDCLCFDEGWNFAGRGQFGAETVEPFATCDATTELYEAVYGEPPEHDEAA